MIIRGVNILLAQLRSIVSNISVQSMPVDVNTVLHIREGITKIAQQISKTNSAVSSRLDALQGAFSRKSHISSLLELRQFASSLLTQLYAVK